MIHETLSDFLDALSIRGVRTSLIDEAVAQASFQKSSAIISANSDELNLHIKRLMTDPGHGGKGHATRLMTEMIVAARSSGAELSLVPVIFGSDYDPETHKERTGDVIRLYEDLGFTGAPLMIRTPETGLSLRSVKSLYPDICFAMNLSLDDSPENVGEALSAVLSSKLSEVSVPHHVSPEGEIVMSLSDGEHIMKITRDNEDVFPDYIFPTDLISAPFPEEERSAPDCP